MGIKETLENIVDLAWVVSRLRFAVAVNLLLAVVSSFGVTCLLVSLACWFGLEFFPIESKGFRLVPTNESRIR
jgi:hypothetical protein